MSDPRFFSPRGPFTTAHLAGIAGAELRGDGDVSLVDVAALADAGSEHLSFLDNRKYSADLETTRAGAVIVAADFAGRAPQGTVLLVHPDPYKAYARLAQAFHPLHEATPESISPLAQIDASAKIGARCVIGPGVVIAENVTLGDDVLIAPNVVIGRAVEIGSGSAVGASASLTHCLIGKRVRILPGARIGQEGFGFAIDAAGHIRIPQLGRVIVEDDVEIGANTTIDRGAGPDTVIGRGSMIDNLVQIGHNVVLGPGCVIVAQVGISGSTRLEAGVALGGQAGVAGHLKLGRGSQVAAQSGVMRDVEPGARMMGYPAVTSRRFFRQLAWMERAAAVGNRKRTKEEQD